MNKWENAEPAVPIATFLELEFLRNTGQHELALELCLKITQKAPLDFLAQGNLAIAYSNTEQYDLTIETYNNILRISYEVVA